MLRFVFHFAFISTLTTLHFAMAEFECRADNPAVEPTADTSNDRTIRDGDPDRGWELLRSKPYLPSDFDQSVFDNLWMSWPNGLRMKVAQATPKERRRMTFERYGLVKSPESSNFESAIGYLKTSASVSKSGRKRQVHQTPEQWVMNCFACHAGSIDGKTIPGLPNTTTALQTLTEEVRITKIRLAKQFTHLDVASLTIPLNTTNGTTNSVMFGVALGNFRDADMNVISPKTKAKLVHHDVDAPPWWHVKKKQQLYIDGFSPKNHRVLMQFMLLPLNTGETVREWESDFKDILAYIETVEAPKYPGTIDHRLAAEGRVVFENNCAKCHGTYGENETYPEVTVPIDELKTDPVRLTALSTTHRQWMKDGWMSRYGKDQVVVDPKGYVAPPLDGVWATAPYFHNGSVPSLWHVLHPENRPDVWRRLPGDTIDHTKMGFKFETFEEMPASIKSAAERRQFFDASQFGKSNKGHDYPNALSEDEKKAVLEYLKSL